MSLVEEDIEGIRISDSEPDVGLIERDCLRLFSMNSSKIDHQLIVNEYPNIVVSGELELFVSKICESTMKLESKMIVVAVRVITKSSIVNGKEFSIIISIDESGA